MTELGTYHDRAKSQHIGGDEISDPAARVTGSCVRGRGMTLDDTVCSVFGAGVSGQLSATKEGAWD